MSPASGAFRVHDGIPADWDACLRPEDSPMSSRWVEPALLRLAGPPVVFEWMRPDGSRVRLLGAVATTAGTNRRTDAYAILSGGSADLGLAAGPGASWCGVAAQDVHPALVLMAPNFETTPVGAAAGDPVALGNLLAAIGRWRRERGLRAVASLYLPWDAPALPAALRAAGAAVVPLTDRCVLDVTWTDFDGYLRTLPSKRRVSIRRERRALRQAGAVLREAAVADHVDRFVDLRCGLVRKYGGEPDPVRERRHLLGLAGRFGSGSVTVLVAESGGRPVSFSLFVQEGTRWTALLTGSDRTAAAGCFGYFATLFYEAAELAPARGVSLVDYGLGSWDAKVSRGCRRRPLLAAATPLDGTSVL